jgi:acyl-CoA thioesterase FadM
LCAPVQFDFARGSGVQLNREVAMVVVWLHCEYFIPDVGSVAVQLRLYITRLLIGIEMKCYINGLTYAKVACDTRWKVVAIDSTG